MDTEYRGITASDGLFMGPVRRLSHALKTRIATGDPAAEREALKAALAQSIAELGDLMGRVEGEAADILGFQVAMLEDDALAAPAMSAIAEGIAADAAWSQAMASEIAG